MMQKTIPIISVVLCTYNRTQLLPTALNSLASQSLEKSRYEIVVVDNASTDNTSGLVKAFQTKCSCPVIVLVSEQKQGLGHARNTGYKQARGRYVAFIDDDCVATKDWLQTLLECFEQVRPQPWSVGGPILPIYEKPKPMWFKDRYETDTWGHEPRFLRRGESFTGCNMSFRKDVIEKYGGFEMGLGMKGDTLALAEETKLYRKIWSVEGDGSTFYYSPQAVIHHIIDPYKMSVSYQLKRAFSVGQASWAMAQMDPMVRRWMMCVGSIALIPWHCIRALLHIRIGHWQSWAVEELYPVAANIGRLSSYLGLRMAFRQRSVIT